jgi:hypothetical protein
MRAKVRGIRGKEEAAIADFLDLHGRLNRFGRLTEIENFRRPPPAAQSPLESVDEVQPDGLLAHDQTVQLDEPDACRQSVESRRETATFAELFDQWRAGVVWVTYVDLVRDAGFAALEVVIMVVRRPPFVRERPRLMAFAANRLFAYEIDVIFEMRLTQQSNTLARGGTGAADVLFQAWESYLFHVPTRCDD